MKPGLDFIGIGCGAFILNDKKEVLLSRRTALSRNEAGRWAVPGGKIEAELSTGVRTSGVTV